MDRATRLRLTRSLIRELSERIKAGAFEHTAAESLGVPREVLARWQTLGTQDGKIQAIFRALADALRRARGHARVMAEIEMRTQQPKVWLLHGPGKETPTTPGWSAMIRASSVAVESTGQFEHLCSFLLEALAPTPTIRAQVADLLAASARTV